jgi:hypothetical protein
MCSAVGFRRAVTVGSASSAAITKDPASVAPHGTTSPSSATNERTVAYRSSSCLRQAASASSSSAGSSSSSSARASTN